MVRALYPEMAPAGVMKRQRVRQLLGRLVIDCIAESEQGPTARRLSLQPIRQHLTFPIDSAGAFPFVAGRNPVRVNPILRYPAFGFFRWSRLPGYLSCWLRIAGHTLRERFLLMHTML